MTGTLAPDLETATLHPIGDGDVGACLEELIVDTTPSGLMVPGPATGGMLQRVELVGPHIRLAGDVNLGRFRRLSDVINQLEGLMRLADVTGRWRI
jgi:hypothetical protein